MNTHSIPSDSIDRLIADRLPPWLATATVEQIRALHQALRHEQQVAAQVARHFERLPSIDAFATPLLVHALQDLGLVDADVRAMSVHIEQTVELPAASPKLLVNRYTYRPRQSLLAAALHNFHEEELKPHLLRQAWLTDAKGQRLSLSFETFVRCCRNLDLGGQYQRLLANLLSPKAWPTAPAGAASRAVEQMLESNLRAKLEVAMRLARLKGELDEFDFRRILPLWTTVPSDEVPPGQVSPRQLYVLGKCMRGVLALEQREGGVLQSITLWIAQDPQAPVTRHVSWEALYRWLGERLRETRYRQFFARFISERDRPAFVHALAEVLKSTPPGAVLPLDARNLAIDGPLFDYLRQLQTNKMLDDARVLAVPTAEEDMASRHARLQALLGAGLDLLNLATLFVPGLGEILLVFSAAQIAAQVYQSYESWRIGDRQQALDHLFGVVEMAATAVALGVVGYATFKALPRFTFVDELAPVVDSAGRVLLKKAEPPVHALAEPGELVRRLQGIFTDLSDQQADVLLQVTDLAPEQLRRLQAEEAPPLARLYDLRQRMSLHEQLPALRGAAFEEELARNRPPASSDQALLKRAFPSLSVYQAAEILENVSTARIDELRATGRVPLPIAEHARWAIRDARLDRACLGFHVEQAINPDTERLALGLLERVAPWPGEVSVAIREGSEAGPVVASAGAPLGTDVRILVNTGEGYRVSAAHSSSQTVAVDSLWQALLAYLEPEQKRLIGTGSLTEGQLRARLADQAAADRRYCADLLGMAKAEPGVRPPIRFADGRLGYPLSGRMPGGQQAYRNGIRRIYPTLTDTQLQVYIEALIEGRTDPWQHYAQLEQALAHLNQALQRWRNEAGLLASVRRSRVATQMRRCWRRKLTDSSGEYVLQLEGERVGNLPSLPQEINYSHVTRLALRDMDLSTIDEDFLSRFSRITELDLCNNLLTEVPAGLDRLRHLRVLSLARNRIVMTEEGNRRLLQLPRLRVLDLSHNPLGQMPELAGLSHLVRLQLRNTRLETLPGRAEALPWRARLDLRNNRITRLQEHLRHLTGRISLHDNPLDAASARAHALLSGLAGPSERPGLLHPHNPVDGAVLEHWIGSASELERSNRTQLWNSLRAEEDSADLFQFLADFTGTQEFEARPEHYQQRVWHMLEMARESQALRSRLFETASGERTCEDRVLLVMSQLELSMLVEQAMIDGPPGEVETRLLALQRSLFRIDVLDEIATRHVERLHERDEDGELLLPVDEVEVRLYYRVKLRQKLDLPATPRGMYYADFANVSDRDLREALHAVRAAENPQALAASLAQRPFWQSFVRTRYSDRFDTLLEPFYARLDGLQSGALSSAQWVGASNALKLEVEAAEQALVRLLAVEAYAKAAA